MTHNIWYAIKRNETKPNQSNSSDKPLGNAGVKNSQKSKIIIEKILKSIIISV